jgi:hypothetical protein
MVSLYLRVLEGGRQKLILANTRKQASEGIYYLRLTVKERHPDGTLKEKRVLESVGTDLRGAILRRNRKEEFLQDCGYVIEPETKAPAKPAKPTLVQFLPEPEKFVAKLGEYAGLVLIVARGLVGHYADIVEMLEAHKRR